MNLTRFDRLAIGLVLVLGIFSLDLTTQVGGFLYLIPAFYILRFSRSSMHSFTLAIATSLSIILGYFLSDNYAAFSGEHIGVRAISLIIVGICLYANLQFERLLMEKKEDDELIKSLTAQREQAITQLQTANGDLMLQVDKRKHAEQELLKRKKLQDAMAHNFPNGVICVLNTEMKFILADGGEMEELGLIRNNKKIDNVSFNLSSVEELKNAFKGEHVSQSSG